MNKGGIKKRPPTPPKPNNNDDTNNIVTTRNAFKKNKPNANSKEIYNYSILSLHYILFIITHFEVAGKL